MSTTQTYPESNLITKADLARARELDFALQFSGSVKKLMEVLGVTRKEKKVAGTTIKAYKAQGTLQSGAVAEGDLIPLSKYSVVPVTLGEITLNKWRLGVSAEAIIEKGFDQASAMTTEKLLKDAQKTIRADMFSYMAQGTTVTGGATFQKAIAKAWGQLQVLFEDDDTAPVFFMNPLDIADYLGEAQITTQTAFGMAYVENFLGLGTVITNSNVPQGKIYATAKSNLVVYYVDAKDNDLAEAGFDFTTDETGLIGIHTGAKYDNVTSENVIISGIAIFAERLDGVVVSLIDTTPSLSTLTLTAADGTASGDTKITVTESKQAATDKYFYAVDTEAKTVKYGEIIKTGTGATAWKSWDGSADITAASGKVISIVETSADNRAQALGSANAHPKA